MVSRSGRKQIVIVLPLPPPELSPNVHVHWRIEARATRGYREHAWAQGRLAGLDKKTAWLKAIARPVFYFACHRERDPDNFGASLKAAYDGLQDAGLIVNDSGIKPMPAKIEFDAERPRVEITFERIA